MKSNPIYFVFSFIFFLSTASIAHQCHDLFKKEKPYRIEKIEQSEKLVSIRDQIHEILSVERFKGVFSGARKPDWNDYNQLVALKKLILGSTSVSKIKYLNADERMILKVSIKEAFEKMNFEIDQIHINKKSAEYKKFLDYHFAWFKLIEEINSLSGIKILPEADLSVIRPNQKLIADGEAIVHSLEKIFTDTFESSGHKNFFEFTKYLNEFSPEAKKKSAITENGLVVAMHRPEGARFWIPISGFQNQRVTGTSRGSMNPAGRDLAEANLTNTKVDDYSPLSARLKPNYAEIRPHMSNAENQVRTHAGHYGSDLWIFKKSAIEKRTTWTPVDSLGPAWNKVSNINWSNIFIPWKFKKLITPYWMNGQTDYRPGEIPNDFKLDFGQSASRFSRRGSTYFEAQIWGPSTINDIQAFVFQKNPPNKEFYDYLVSKNIEIWDERTWPAKKYSGEESK